jgi:hypothetical protein
MRGLVAAETSGEVRRAFAARGWDMWSCDLLPADDDTDKHIQGDMRPLLREPWDLVIAHPPCTRLCNSGVSWLAKRNLWAELDEAAALFRDCLDANAPRVCVENPIPHKYALERIGVLYSQRVQPWWFGHGETKATCLWLKGLPPLMATKLVQGREQRLHRLPPSPTRWKERSKTYPGLAAAMAAQWG